MFPITIFNSKNTGKFPSSPYNDDTFIFNTLDVNEEQLIHIIANNYILNIPVNLKEPIRSHRRKENLKEFLFEKVPYIILDFDHVNTIETHRKIIDYFKQFKCILLESRGCNFIDNFNIKGFLFCDIETRLIKKAFSILHYELSDFCDLDESQGRISSFNAPIGKLNVLLNNFSCENTFNFNKIDVPTVEHIVKDFKLPKLNDYDNIDTIEQLCLKVFHDLGFTALKSDGNCVIFSHPNEVKTPGGYFWFMNSPYIMNHFNQLKTINIFEDVRKMPIYKKIVDKPLNYNELFNYSKTYKTIKINEKFIILNDEIKNAIDEFLINNNGLFAIKSPMGTGKSIIISSIIKEAQEQDMRVLVVTNRISVAEDFNIKYGLKVYNKDKYQIGDSLICQYDSLWKYNIKYFDIVVMDEFISLLLHSRNTINNTSVNITKFFASFNKKLIIADAFLTGYENKILQCKKENCYLIENEYRDDTQLNLYENFNCFIQRILESSKKHKITISCTSISIINALQILLTKYGIKVATLTSETPESSKKLVYSHFDKDENDKWDCLIFSPTLTVGVSNLNNVYEHFHYDNSITTDVISSIQMLKRTRKAKIINIFIKNRTNFYKTTYETIRDEYLNSVGKNIENNYIFELNDYGETKISKIGKFAIQVDLLKNILEKNHKDCFMYLLKFHFKNDFKINDDNLYSNILLKYQKENKENEKLLFESNIEQFKRLSNMTFEDIDLTFEKKNLFEKIVQINDRILDCTSVIREKIIKLAFKDKQFLNKCKYFKLLKMFCDNELDLGFVNRYISKCILQNDFETLEFCNQLLKIDKSLLKDMYIPSKVPKELKNLLKKCSYKIDTYKNQLGRRFYMCNRDILELYKYINI